MTPLGRPVDPEVYCKKARSSRATSGETHSEAKSTDRVSVAKHSPEKGVSACVRRVEIFSIKELEVSAIAASASILDLTGLQYQAPHSCAIVLAPWREKGMEFGLSR